MNLTASNTEIRGIKMATKEKELTVQMLSGKFKSNSCVLLTEYRGLTVAEISELRAKLRPAKCEYKVVKNTLTKRALKDLKLESFSDFFDGPTAVAIDQGDPVQAAKILVDFAKEHTKLKLKAGLLGDKVLTEKDIKSLASLPSREVLIGTLVWLMKSPVQNLVYVINGNTQKLVYVLDAIKKQKEGK